MQSPRKANAPRTGELRRQDPLVVDEEDPLRSLQHPCGELIHPGTAKLFRAPLQAILATVPFMLVQAIVEEGYRLHVVDTQLRYPLTLPILAPPLDELPPETVEWEGDWEELAWQRGAQTAEEANELLGWMETLNPERGARLQVAPYRFWGGQRVLSGAENRAWEFLSQPLRSFVAGMVTHGEIEGIEDENRIVFWDCAFERGDGLLPWYVLHEIGHTTDYSFAFRLPDAWRAWRSRVEEALQAARSRGLITRYAGDSVHEYLAEGFAAWALVEPLEIMGTGGDHGDLALQRLALNRERLAAQDPALCELLSEAVAALQSTCRFGL